VGAALCPGRIGKAMRKTVILMATMLMALLLGSGIAFAAEIIGTNSDDIIEGTLNNDTIYGRGGDDSLKGRFGDDYIYGGPGRDFLGGQPDNDHLDGGRGADFITGGGHGDVLVGGDGGDTMDGNDGSDTHLGGDGPDNIEDRFTASDDLNGGDDDDILNAQDESALDKLNGGFGFDTCFADATDEVISCESLNPTD
jgi:Ca2+-binding RTX toxin-like protein